MKTKEELLQSIYGAEYIHADINGWMKYGMYHPNDLGFDNDEVDRYGNMDLWRPKSLNGIESNNGWISINSEKDLPGEDLDVHIVFKKDGGNFQTFGVWDKRLNSFWSGAMKIDIPTHYQPIVKPLKPLHK